VWDWLHREKSEKRCNSNDKNVYQAKSSEISTRIVESRKKIKFNEIFSALDSNNDGEIDSKNIDIKAIQIEILQLITPLLIEMEQFNQSLIREEFFEAMDKLFKGLTSTEKSIILGLKYF
jgi:hypothetical protein